MIIQATGLTEKATLGLGYNVRQQEFVGQCAQMIGPPEFVGNQREPLVLSVLMMSQRWHKKWGLRLESKFAMGCFQEVLLQICLIVLGIRFFRCYAV